MAGNMGSISGLEGFYQDHALEPVSHNYRAQEQQLLKPMHALESVLHKRSHRKKQPIWCNEEYFLLATIRETLHKAMKTPRSQLRKKQKKKNGNGSQCKEASQPDWDTLLDKMSQFFVFICFLNISKLLGKHDGIF